MQRGGRSSSTARPGWLAASVALACTSSTPASEPPKPASEAVTVEPERQQPSDADEASDPAPDVTASMTTFEARVEIDAQPSGKKFQGVWLVSDDDQRSVIAYRPDPLWRPFEGRRVEVTGAYYQPQGQAIGAKHFRVHSLKVIAPMPQDALVSVAEERWFTGKFLAQAWPIGSKGEHDSSTVFVTDDGTTYQLANTPEHMAPLNAGATVKARQVELSPFAAHIGGPHLWVLDVVTGGD